MSTQVRLLYFAALSEAAGMEAESIQTDAADLATLYAQVSARHGLGWPLSGLRVAVDGLFAQWGDPVREGSEIVFIPPVSGG